MVVQEGGRYLGFANVEQIITDSFVLMIMNVNKQMVLSKYKMDITAQINNMVSMPVTASSIKNLTETYINGLASSLTICSKSFAAGSVLSILLTGTVYFTLPF